MRFVYNEEKCIGCGACSVACMDQHDTDLAAGEAIIRKVDNTSFTTSGCLHCQDAPCIASCPKGCLFKDENGLTLYDSSSCIGCRLCVRACPHDAIRFQGSVIVKCDGCHTLLECGLKPPCVEICPTRALTLEP